MEQNPSSELLDAQARDRPPDHELLDLFGAFEDVVGLRTSLKRSSHPAARSVLAQFHHLSEEDRACMVDQADPLLTESAGAISR